MINLKLNVLCDYFSVFETVIVIVSMVVSHPLSIPQCLCLRLLTSQWLFYISELKAYDNASNALYSIITED